MKKRLKEKGITLIALIVTILVLLILATVGINIIVGDNGILNKAKQANKQTGESQEQENTTLSDYNAIVDETLSGTSRSSNPTYCTTPANTVSTASITNPAVVIENYKNGTQWYRVWSDGWIEQGGQKSGAGTITFLKAFTDTTYTITGGLLSGTESTTYEHLNFRSFTTTTVYFSTYDSYSVRWYACGY